MSTLERGSSGQFDVLVDGELIASKTAPRPGQVNGTFGFPLNTHILELLRARLAGAAGET